MRDGDGHLPDTTLMVKEAIVSLIQPEGDDAVSISGHNSGQLVIFNSDGALVSCPRQSGDGYGF